MYYKGQRLYLAGVTGTSTLIVATDADMFSHRVMVLNEGSNYPWPLDTTKVDVEGGDVFTDAVEAAEAYVCRLGDHVKELARNLGVKTQQLNNARETLLAMKGE